VSAGSLAGRSLVQRAFTLRAHNIGRQVLSGAGFQFLGIALRTLITLGSTAALARLLSPSDFGHLAMATVVTELAALFSNFGFTNILIQRRRISRLQLDTVFWASLLLGVALALAVAAFSLLAPWAFGDAKVGELLRLLCLTFVLGGLTTVPWVIMARLMRFRTEFWVQLLAVAIRTAVAIACAWWGMGVWSLVAGSLTGAAVQALLGFVFVPYWPRLRFQQSFIRSTWRTSGSYFGGGLLYYANMNIDLMVIGRQLGAVALGYYQNARGLTDEIRGRIAMPLQHVLFPAFSAVQSDMPRARQMVMRSGRVLAAVVVPIGVGVAAMADELVPVLYGDKWLSMIPLLSMFGLSAAIKASTAIATPIINSHDRVAAALRYQVISCFIVVGSILVALPFGLHALAAAVVVSSFYSLAPFWFALRLLGLGMRAGWQMLGGPFLASLCFWSVIELARPFTATVLDVGPLLVLHVTVAALIYLAVLHLISRQYLTDLRELVLRWRR
jgi:PST family polysaccharide transporter